jgi:hypothetical protein
MSNEKGVEVAKCGSPVMRREVGAQSEDLFRVLFQNDNIKQCSRKPVSSSEKLNELRQVVHS